MAEKLACIERVDQIPDDILEVLQDCWIRGYKLYQMTDRLKELGYRVKHPSRLISWCKQLFPETMREDLEDPVEKWVDLPDEEQALRLLWHKTMLAARMVEVEKKSALERITKLATAAGRLATAMVAIRRTALEKSKAIAREKVVLEKAKEELLAEFRKVVPDRPDLIREIQMVYEAAVNRISVDSSENDTVMN